MGEQRKAGNCQGAIASAAGGMSATVVLESRFTVQPRRPDGGDGELAKREVRSEDLFEGERVVLIRHAGSVYTLRRTSHGKLILTK